MNRRRTRTHPAIVRYAIYLYFSSRSFRLAANCLESITKRNHVSIWKWVQKYANYTDRFGTDRRRVKEIFVDETLLLQVDGQKYWLWIAYEPNLNSCLLMHLSTERRTIFVCYQFFKQLRDRFGRKPIFTDGALWCNEACKWLRL
jgi:putative transposase